MKISTASVVGALLIAAGFLVGFTAAKPDDYPVDGRVGSMTTEHLQRAIFLLGLDARSFAYETTREHVLRIDVEDYVDGKLDKTERLGRHEVPHVGKQSFMIFSDTRDKDHFVLSSAFIGPSGNSESANAWLRKPKSGWGSLWNEKAVLRVGEKAPLYYCMDRGKKGMSFPMPVAKMVAEYPRVIVIYATLESEDGK
ncbi:MAG: hypothetical protein EHM91_16455 [Planctomycetota bacterium]|nr:MAG: hypothetical protein EHM91_16455 [Planctomycetota bacterium]